MTNVQGSGILTMTFDDGLLSQFEHAYPVLHRHHVNGVVFVPTGLVGGWFSGEPTMGLHHLRELAAEGWEIGSHTVSHHRLAGRDGATRLSLPAIDREAGESRAWLAANGFPVMSFAYPNGRYNAQVEAVVSRYYRFIRTTENGLNQVSSRSSQLKVFDLCQRKLDLWKPAVDAARASAKWLVVMIHGVVECADQIGDGDSRFRITKDALAECLEYGLAAGLQPRTFREMCDALNGSHEAAETRTHLAGTPSSDQKVHP